MAKLTLSTGITANDGSGDSLRAGAQKINNNFDELYASLGDGNSIRIITSGASNGEVLAFNGTNFVPTATGGVNSFGSIITDSGSFSAGAPGSSLNVIGGNGIDTRIANNVLIIDATGGGSSGGASVTVSETPPSTPNDGDLWYDSSLGVLAVWYDDQGYWIQTNSAAQIDTVTIEGGSGGTGGASTFLELTDTPSSFTADYIVKVNSAGDGLEFVESTDAASAFTPLEISTNYIAQVYNWIFADTSSAPITITLPTTANLGDEIRILDSTGSFGTNNLTVQSNLNIQGDAQNFIVDINYAGFTLVFVNNTIGWLLKDR